MSGVRRSTRAASAARSDMGASDVGISELENATPAPTRRGARTRVSNTVKRADIKKPAVTNRISTAYGSAGKFAAPVHTAANQALRSASDRFTEAVNQVNSGKAAQLGGTDERNEESEHHDQNASLASKQLLGELSQPLTSNAQSSFSDVSAWAPRGVIDEHQRDQLPSLYDPPHVIGGWDRFVARVLGLLSAIMYLVAQPIHFLASSRKLWWLLLMVPGLIIAYNMISGPLLSAARDLPIFQRVRPSPDFVSPTPARTSIQVERHQQIINEFEKRIHALESHNVAQHSWSKSVRGINWFEFGQGAQIDTRLTSPTFAIAGDNWWQLFLARFSLRKAKHIPMAGTAAQALKKWDDGGVDRWCAPRSRGKLQIVISTSRPIAPTDLIVENISKENSILSGSAPREIELFIQITELEKREKLIHRIEDWEPSHFAPSYPQGRDIDPKNALGEEYVSVGKWHYDINSLKEVQTFRITQDLASLGISTQKIAFRANSNWGDLNSTCINRLRLFGGDQSFIKEYLEPPLPKAIRGPSKR